MLLRGVVLCCGICGFVGPGRRLAALSDVVWKPSVPVRYRRYSVGFPEVYVSDESCRGWPPWTVVDLQFLVLDISAGESLFPVGVSVPSNV